MVHLDYRDARPIYLQIVDGLRAQIRAGVLQEGDRLPSVRELATSLAINPNTIQRAYRELDSTGWVLTVPGKGCFVSQVPQQEQTQALLAEFDRTVAQLLSQGITREQLLQHLEEGGNPHA